MAVPLTDGLLARLRKLVVTHLGLYFPPARRHDLERGLNTAARMFGFADATAYSHWLLSGPLTRRQVEGLATYLTVGETYFFRERATFNALQEYILPELIQARRKAGRQLRIWSAGCCTGEEPYSIAILLSQLISDWPDWSVRILATDINPQFLDKAVEGVYGKWSFRGLPPLIKERYFRETKTDCYEILPQIRERVTFSSLNLANAVYPSALNQTEEMDVIFCRNVLMYFAPEQAKKVVQNLYHSLAEDGWLIPGPSETSHTLFSEFRPIHFPDAVLYQKQSVPAAGEAIRRITTGLAIPEEPMHQEGSETAAPDPTRLDSISPDPSPAQETETAALSLHHSLSLYKQGRYSSAESQARLWLLEYPQDVQAMVLMTRIYANQGKLDEALAWCRRAVALDPLNLDSHYLHATIQQERGKIEEAVASLKRVLYLDPDFAPAHFTLGILAREPREADKHFTNAIAVLRSYRAEAVLPESGGLTAGKLLEMIQAGRSSYRPEQLA